MKKIFFYILILFSVAFPQIVERNISSITDQNQWIKVSIPIIPDAFNPQDSSKFFEIFSDVKSVWFEINYSASAIRFDVDDFKLVSKTDSIPLHTFNNGYERWNTQESVMQWFPVGGRDGGPFLRAFCSGEPRTEFSLLPPREYWYGDLRQWIGSRLEFYARTELDIERFALRFSAEKRPELRLIPDSTMASFYTGIGFECVPADTAVNDTIFLTSSTPSCLNVPDRIILNRGEWSQKFNATSGYSPTVGCKPVIRAESKSSPGRYTAVTVTLGEGKNDFPLIMGRVMDAESGNVIDDARVSIGDLTTTTDDTGGYRIRNIDLLEVVPDFYAVPKKGHAPLQVQFYDNSLQSSQLISIIAPGYESIQTKVRLERNKPNIVNILLSPLLKENQYRFELHWGQRPDDLDLHLLTPELSGRIYDISAQQQGQNTGPPWAIFNQDFNQGFGPEIITLYQPQLNRYRLYVENYSRYPALSESGAYLDIYDRNGLMNTINIPVNGEGDYWYIGDVVFSLDSVKIEPVNVIQVDRPAAEVRSLRKPKIVAQPFNNPLSAIEEWAWDFDGDGKIDSYDRFPVFEYTTAGSYSAQLRIKSKDSYFHKTRTDYIVVQPEVQYPTIWRQQKSGFLTDLTAVSAIDSLSAWAVSENGNILATTNGGAGWDIIPENETFHFHDILFSDHRLGWIGGYDDKGNALLLSTKNGGYTWMRFSRPSPGAIQECFMLDSKIGYLVGASGKIEKTVNGGIDWQSQNSGTSEDLFNLFFLNADTGWVVGEHNTVLFTNNGGEEWRIKNIGGERPDLLDVYFVNSNTGFIVTSRGVILQSKNGGEKWEELTRYGDDPLYSIDFINPNLGFIAGSNGVILRTSNGGQSWMIDNSGTTEDLNDIVIINQACGWAVGDRGTIIKLDLSEEQPNSIQNLVCETRGSGAIELTWDNPAQPEFSGCKILRKRDVFPSHPYDGVEVYRGTDENFVDYDVDPATTYYYSAFAFDHYNRFSELQNEAFCYATTLDDVDVEGYKVTINSIDISRFPTIVNFITIVDDKTLQPVSDIGIGDILVKEDGVEEAPEAFEQINTSSGGKADIVFVFDVTASMTQEIEDLKNRASSFADSLAAKGIDYRLALVSFSDNVESTYDFTDDIVQFKQWIETLSPVGGGDYKENALEGMAKAGELSFRGVSQRLMILITDAEYHQAGDPGDGTTLHTTESITDLLQEKRIVADIAGPNFEQFHQLALQTGGFYFDINSDFAQVVDHIGLIISSQYVCTYNTHNIDEDDKGRNVEILVQKADKGGYDFDRYRYGKVIENVKGFIASAAAPDKIYCRWQNPSSPKFDGVMVLRNQRSFPKTTSDGIVVYTGKLSGFIDAGLSPEMKYYYAAFAYSTDGSYARATTASQASAATLPVWSYNFQLNQKTTSIREDIHKIFFKDSLKAVAIGSKGLFATSEDGGSQWNQNPLPGNHQLYDVYFTSHSDAWIVGKNSQNSGMILQSKDGGKTWQQKFSSSEYAFYALEFVSDSIGWAIGDKGIVKQTTDAGNNWLHRYRNDPLAFYAMDFINNTTGWVAGPLGRIMKTVDAGMSWQDQTSGVTSTIRDLCFLDSKRGWAVTSEGEICQTSNGGETWISKTVSDLPLNAVAFSDLVNGYAIGDQGTLFKTRTGGKTWEKVDTRVEFDLNDIALVSPLKGMIVGDGGLILQIIPASSETNLSGYYVNIHQIESWNFPNVSCCFSVFDQTSNRTVDNISADQISLLENGLSRPIESIENVKAGDNIFMDIVFILNTVSSMQAEIEVLQTNISTLDNILTAKGFIPRYALITYHEEVEFAYSFTSDLNELMGWFDVISCKNDAVSHSLPEALSTIEAFDFRTYGQRFALLCTDSPMSGSVASTAVLDSVTSSILDNRLHLFSIALDTESYRTLSEKSGGLLFDIESGFKSALDLIQNIISSQHRIIFQAQQSQVKVRNISVMIERGEKGGSTNTRFSLLSPSVSILPREVVGIKNESFFVNLFVDQVNAFKSGHFKVSYDPTRVKAVQVREGDFFEPNTVSADLDFIISEGELVIDLRIVYEDTTRGMFGYGNLCSIEFQVISENTCNLDIQSAELWRTDLSAIVALTAGAKVYPLENLTGDFDADGDIDMQDFALFSTFWKPANDRKGDIGPANGKIPLITSVVDKLVNYEDLFVFAQMWNWFNHNKQQDNTVQKSTIKRCFWDIKKASDHHTAILYADGMNDFSMGHVVLQYNPAGLSIKKVYAGRGNNSGDQYVFFSDFETSGLLDISFANLSLSSPAMQKGPHQLLSVDFKLQHGGGSPIKINQIDLRDNEGKNLAVAGIEEIGTIHPLDYYLEQNYPNPFNNQTSIHFQLPEKSSVVLKIVNIMGQTVDMLIQDTLPAGRHCVKWGGEDLDGNAVSSGIYFIVFKANQYTRLRRLLLLK